MPFSSDVPEITPTALKERLDRGDVPLLIDVREAFEQAIADLPDYGQMRIPVGEFEARMEEVRADRDVVLYCRSGKRSERAASLLLGTGRERVFNLRGGVLGWRAEVDPTLQAY